MADVGETDRAEGNPTKQIKQWISMQDPQHGCLLPENLHKTYDLGLGIPPF